MSCWPNSGLTHTIAHTHLAAQETWICRASLNLQGPLEYCSQVTNRQWHHLRAFFFVCQPASVRVRVHLCVCVLLYLIHSNPSLSLSLSGLQLGPSRHMTDSFQGAWWFGGEMWGWLHEFMNKWEYDLSGGEPSLLGVKWKCFMKQPSTTQLGANELTAESRPIPRPNIPTNMLTKKKWRKIAERHKCPSQLGRAFHELQPSLMSQSGTSRWAHKHG